jgi:predicted TIM-barrel fold metal-dependent hydrolase
VTASSGDPVPSTRFLDMFGSFPTALRLAFDIRSWGSVRGYNQLFGARLARVLDIPVDVIEAVRALDGADYARRATELLEPHTRTAAELVRELTGQGVTRMVLHNPLPTRPYLSNDSLAELVGQHPDVLVGFCRVDLDSPERAAAEVRRCTTSLGLSGVTYTPFWHRVRADDRALDPIYAACVEADVPIWIHTSIFWERHVPLTYEHPLYLDDVAARFPDLRIIAGHGGWPWIAEMVAVAWRQPNVYVDISAFRPRHIATVGSGWEPLWYQIPRMLAGKVVLGSTWQLLGSPVSAVLAEVDSLGLPDNVLDRWKYANLARVLKLGDPA